MNESNNSRLDADLDGRGYLSPAAIKAQLQRILESPRFVESPRLCAFLRYVVEAKLANQEDQIQEYTIGVSVFHRGEAFDPRIDSIVRVEARRLRDRLSEYYAGAGKDDPVSIDLPLGGYKPKFSEKGDRKPASSAKPSWSGPNVLRFLSNAWLAWIVTLAALAACVILLLQSRPEPREGAVALSLAAPGNAELLTPRRGGGPVVSPDGRRVVFPVRDESGKVFLCLRSTDRVAAVRLAGTENAIRPFWSPDGSKIGFGALGKLKVLDLRRSEVLTVADIPNYQDGTWSDMDGGVIVVSTSSGPLLRLPTAGGTPQVVFPLDSDELAHEQPIFLPDGRRLLFTSVPREGAPLVRVADLGAGKWYPLPQTSSHPKYARTSDGRHFLLFNDRGTLSARQVDPDTLEFVAPGASLAHGLRHYLSGTFSVAGDTLAYFNGPFPVSDSKLVWRSRAGERLGTLGNPANYIWISLAPDERTVAAAIPTDLADVWTIDAATGVSTRQTDHPKLDRTPTWSPDGRQLLISTDRDGDGGRIYIVSADGSGHAEPWLSYPQHGWFSDWPSQWHPKTSTVLFSRHAEGGHDIWVKDPGTPPRLLIAAPGSQINARLSPDARRIAYASNELGEWEIFLSDYPPVGSRIRVSPDGGNFPMWNSNGRELFYVAPNGGVMAVEVPAGQRLKALLPRTLFRVRFPVSPAPFVYQYAVASDANRFLLVEEIEGHSATAIVNWERLLDR